MFNLPMTSQIELFAQPGLGEVVQAIAPNRKGRIKFRASFWPARFYQVSETAVLPSEQVAVVGRQGITLLVVTLANELAN